MKLIIVIVVGVIAYNLASSSSESFDPTGQGMQSRAAVKIGTSSTDVLEAAGEPSYWRDEPSGFDFAYVDRFEPDTGQVITKRLVLQR